MISCFTLSGGKGSCFTCFQHIKTFSPKYCPSDQEVHITMSEQWLERLIIKFGLMAVESDASKVKFLSL